MRLVSVSSSEISKAKNQTHGVRCDFKYILNDGREYPIRSIKFNSLEEAQQSLIARIPQVEDRFKELDAQEAVSLNITTPYKTAEQGDVWFKYLQDGYYSTNAVDAYNKMSKVAPQVLALNLPIETLAVMFNQPVEIAQDVMDKWTYLEFNKDSILNYEQIEGEL